MRHIKVFAGFAAAALALTACAGGGTEPTPAPESGSAPAESGKAWEGDASEVVITTWWEAGSEKVGFEALADVFKAKYPDITFTKAAVAGGGGSQAKQKLAADLAAGSPPDTFQAHAGAELTDYIDADQILDVSGLYDELGLKEAFPATLVDRLTSDGMIYSVPSNIHRANVVWANPTVLKEAGIDPAKQPANLDEWLADMEKVKAAGKTPLTVGIAWTRLHLFETVLLADLGAEKYNGLFDGSTPWDGEDVTKAIGHFEKLLSFTDKALYTEDWEPAMQPVVDGKAAYNVMGDWAVGSFNAQEKKDGEDYIYFPVPGTQGTFDFLADSFTLPKGAMHPGGTRAWLDVISSKEGQIAFNLAKGSIPARSDLTDEDRAKFPTYQQSAMESFAKDTIVSSIAHGAALPVKTSNAISDAVAKFVEGGSDAAQFQTELAAAFK